MDAKSSGILKQPTRTEQASSRDNTTEFAAAKNGLFSMYSGADISEQPQVQRFGYEHSKKQSQDYTSKPPVIRQEYQSHQVNFQQKPLYTEKSRLPLKNHLQQKPQPQPLINDLLKL